MARVQFAPFVYDPDKAALQRVHRLVVRFDIKLGERSERIGRSRVRRQRRCVPPGLRETPPGRPLYPGLGRDRAGRSPQSYRIRDGSHTHLPRPCGAGSHEITYADLAAAGADLDLSDPATLHSDQSGPSEVAIQMPGQEDGTIDPGDR